MRVLILSFCLLAFTSSAYATPLSSWDKRMFYAQFQTNCEKEAKKTSNGSKAQQENWCKCVNYGTIELITKEDLQPNQAALLNQKTETAAAICRQKLLTPSGAFK
jgi:hypothetical protein